MSIDTNEKNILKTAIAALDEKKGDEITVLDITTLDTALADCFVICTGNSAPQVKALAENVEFKIKEATGLLANHTEGYSTASWILLDYGFMVVHVFHKESREFYGLEKLWGDARRVDIENI